MTILVRLAIRIYQRLVSPVLHWIGGPNSGCRYEPTCSQYFLEAVETHGVGRGGWMGLRRILRCHPWGGFGFDPVPGSARDRACREDDEGHGGCACGRDPDPVTRDAKT